MNDTELDDLLLRTADPVSTKAGEAAVELAERSRLEVAGPVPRRRPFWRRPTIAWIDAREGVMSTPHRPLMRGMSQQTRYSPDWSSSVTAEPVMDGSHHTFGRHARTSAITAPSAAVP